MLTIRLTRKGKKNQPFFRVVVIDKKRSSTGGRAVEDLGYVDPLTKKRNFKKERILYWISKGAKPSASIHNFLVSEKIIEGTKVKITNISKKKQTEIAAAKVVAETPAVAPAAEVKKEEVKPIEPATELPPAPEEKAPAVAEGSGEAKEEKAPEVTPVSAPEVSNEVKPSV